MDKMVERYYEIKQQQKVLEEELGQLRQAILDYCREQETKELKLAGHVVRVVLQTRREYDESKLYEALPDLELWRMLSKPDAGKISSLIKLKVISEDRIKDTYTDKNITLLQVDKK